MNHMLQASCRIHYSSHESGSCRQVTWVNLATVVRVVRLYLAIKGGTPLLGVGVRPPAPAMALLHQAAGMAASPAEEGREVGKRLGL